MTTCISCLRGLYNECGHTPILVEDANEPEDERGMRRNAKSSDRNLKDQQSTGRKRAAKLFPLDEDANCEWKMLKLAGGGQFPIMGCLRGTQQARHHGPDKNTLNNHTGNVHRICHLCHNRWHSANDENYNWSIVQPSHNATDKCSLEEAIESDVNWKLKGKLKKVVD